MWWLAQGTGQATPWGVPPPKPPHLEQLDGHGVASKGLEQIQCPFLQQGEATAAVEEAPGSTRKGMTGEPKAALGCSLGLPDLSRRQQSPTPKPCWIIPAPGHISSWKA